MPSPLNVIRSKYSMDHKDSPSYGNGVGLLAMEGRLISVVDLPVQGIKCVLGNAVAPILALMIAIVFPFLNPCSKENLKKIPTNFVKYTFAFILISTVGIIGNTLLKVLVIVGNAFGILFPAIGQGARRMDFSVADKNHPDFLPIFSDNLFTAGPYFTPRPFMLIASHSKLYSDL